MFPDRCGFSHGVVAIGKLQRGLAKWLRHEVLVFISLVRFQHPLPIVFMNAWTGQSILGGSASGQHMVGLVAKNRGNMDKLTQDAIRMEEITERLADRADIWQDRYVYWMAVAILHIITHIHVREARLAREAEWQREKQKQ